MDAEEPQEVAEQQQDDKGDGAAGQVAQRGLQDAVDQAAQGAETGQRAELADGGEDGSDADRRNNGGEAVGDLRGHTVGHLDSNVILDEDVVDQGHDAADDHGCEQAGSTKVGGGDGRCDGDFIFGNAQRNGQQEDHQGDDADQNGLIFAFQLLCHRVADAEHGVDGHHVGGVSGDVTDNGFQADGGDEVLIDFNVQAGQQGSDGTHHDDGQQGREAVADRFQDFVLGELVGEWNQRPFHCRLKFFQHSFFLTS